MPEAPIIAPLIDDPFGEDVEIEKPITESRKPTLIERAKSDSMGGRQSVPQNSPQKSQSHAGGPGFDD